MTVRTLPPTAPRAARAIATAALVLLLAASLGGCAKSPADTCHDVSGWVCDRLAECGSLATPFGTLERCVDSFDGLFTVQLRTDEGCTGEWQVIQDLPCNSFVAYFEI